MRPPRSVANPARGDGGARCGPQAGAGERGVDGGEPVAERIARGYG